MDNSTTRAKLILMMVLYLIRTRTPPHRLNTGGWNNAMDEEEVDDGQGPFLGQGKLSS